MCSSQKGVPEMQLPPTARCVPRSAVVWCRSFWTLVSFSPKHVPRLLADFAISCSAGFPDFSPFFPCHANGSTKHCSSLLYLTAPFCSQVSPSLFSSILHGLAKVLLCHPKAHSKGFEPTALSFSLCYWKPSGACLNKCQLFDLALKGSYLFGFGF